MMRLLIASTLFALSTIAAAADLKVDAPWTRATLPTQKAAGAFMTLTSAQNAVLVGASSPLAEKTEIHEMRTEGGVMKMNAVPNLALPAGKAVELKSGGNHIMLWGLKQQLKAGEKLPLELLIESGGKRETVKVEAEVRPINAADKSPAHGDQH